MVGFGVPYLMKITALRFGLLNMKQVIYLPHNLHRFMACTHSQEEG